MPGVDLQSAVGVNSSDVVEVLRQFFLIPMVLPVLAVIVALLLLPYVQRGLRWVVMGGRVNGDIDVYGGPSLVSMDELAPVVGPNLDDSITALDPGLPDIYKGHDPSEFDAIEAASYVDFRARWDELDRQQAEMDGADREMIDRFGLDKFAWGEDDPDSYA